MRAGTGAAGYRDVVVARCRGGRPVATRAPLAGEELQFVLADSGSEVVFVDAVFAEHLERNIAAVRADVRTGPNGGVDLHL